MFDVAPRTVASWCDKGQITATRLPGKGDRRVEPAALVRFCQENNMPVPASLQEYAACGVDDPNWLRMLLRASPAKGFHCSAHQAQEIANSWLQKNTRVMQLEQILQNMLDGVDVRLAAEELLQRIRSL